MVVPAPVLPEGLRATIERWPTAHRCAAAATAAADGLVVTVLAPTTGHGHTLTADGVQHRAVEASGRPQMALARAVARCRPHLVHVHGLVQGPLVAAIAATTRRVPLLTQHHGEPVPEGRSRHWMRRTRTLVAGHLFTGGEAHGEPWRRAGLLGRGPVHDVLEASSDLTSSSGRDRAEARRMLGLADAPMVLWVGRATSGKDPGAAIDIAERLHNRGAPHRLVMLATDAASHATLAAMVAGQGLTDRICVHPPVSHAQMGGWYEAADALLSTSHHEGSGFAVIEAMGAGCPVVARGLVPLRSICGPVGRWFAPGAHAEAVDLLTGPLPQRHQVRAEFERRASWEQVGRSLAAVWTDTATARRAA